MGKTDPGPPTSTPARRVGVPGWNAARAKVNNRLSLFGAEFADDGDGGGGADAVCAGFQQGADVG